MTLADATTAVADAACAYASTTDPSKCDPLAIYNGNRENILMLSEVDPGLHSFMEQNKTTPDELEAVYRERSLLKRSVFPEDVAEAVAFFATERSAKSTGNIINVDAGNAGSFTR